MEVAVTESADDSRGRSGTDTEEITWWADNKSVFITLVESGWWREKSPLEQIMTKADEVR